MSFGKWFRNKNHLSQVIFILIMLYAISSINVLLLVFGILDYWPGAYYNPFLLVLFAIISFAITIFISAYHLSTMIRRRKRKTDF